ncbi:MAG: D-2-hydroxyacid dehydrogenase [bacterium]|nr:D-2-hydroxyacid dehydrogenase [bacterium]
MSEPQESIHVVVAMDFADPLIERIRDVSPRLKVERHFPNVPDRAYADAEILYTLRSFPSPALAPRLRWIQLHTAGVDHAIKEPIVQAEDVEVTTTSGIHAVVMAEYCLMMMLTFNYRLRTMLGYQSRAEWPADRHKIFAPRELRGQTVGIVGYGAIGRELARLCDGMGIKVLAVKRDVMHPADLLAWHEPGTGDPEGDLPARIYPPEALVSMAKECDYLVVITPMIDATNRLINEEALKAMKKTAVLINVGRGNAVDEAALISALAAESIGGAALDVFESEPLPPTSPLWNLDNVIISPHVAGHSVRYHEKAAKVFTDNLERYLENQPLLNRIERKRGY